MKMSDQSKTENRKQRARRTFATEKGSIGEKSAKVGSVEEENVNERVSENLASSSRSKVELNESEKKEEREEEREPWS